MRIRMFVTIHMILDAFGAEYNAAPGGDGSAHCPFHGDDLTPSAYVYGDTNKLYCHKCQQGWDVIGFVRAKKGGKAHCKYTKALNIIETMYDLPRLPYPDDDEVEIDDDVEESKPVEVKEPSKPEPVEFESKPVEPKPEPKPAELAEPEEDDDVLKRRVWAIRQNLDRLLVEYRDQMSCKSYAALCHIVDKTVRAAELRLITEKQLQERLSKVRRKLFELAHA